MQRATEVGAAWCARAPSSGSSHVSRSVGGRSLQGSAATYDDVFLPLYGAHQAQNAAVTALAAVEAFLGAGAATGPIEQETVRAAFAAVRSPGRLGQVRTSPTVLVDAAHNPAGMTATVEAIRESFDFTRLVRVEVGVTVSSKDVHGMRSRSRTSARSSSSPRTVRPARCPPTSSAPSPSTSSAPTG